MRPEVPMNKLSAFSLLPLRLILRLLEDLLRIRLLHHFRQRFIFVIVHVSVYDLPAYKLCDTAWTLCPYFQSFWAFSKILLLHHMAGGVEYIILQEARPNKVLIFFRAFHFFRSIP